MWHFFNDSSIRAINCKDFMILSINRKDLWNSCKYSTILHDSSNDSWNPCKDCTNSTIDSQIRALQSWNHTNSFDYSCNFTNQSQDFMIGGHNLRNFHDFLMILRFKHRFAQTFRQIATNCRIVWRLFRKLTKYRQIMRN